MNESLALRLKTIVENAIPVLVRITESKAATRPAPGKWSAKEILGHLIDSASNNHQRFIRAQFRPDLVFDGYDQDEWVRVQGYQDQSWGDLINLWAYFNLHLAHAIGRVPVKELTRERHPHTLYRIAFRTIPEDEPATLGYFIDDYIVHLEHHLKQIGG